MDQFCNQVVTAIANQAHACEGGPADVWTAFLSTPPYDLCSGVSKAVSAGRATYDSSHAQACLSAYASASCAQLINGQPTPDCQAALKGNGAAGSSCYTGSDCANGNFCTSQGGGSCPGICKAEVAAGGSCASGDRCVDGYTCQNGLCTQKPDPSTLGGQGAACGFTATGPRCQPGFACDRQQSTCQPIVREGQSCQPGHGLCELFTFCGGSNICVRWGSAGAACGVTGTSPNMEFLGCLPGAYCNTSSTGTGSGTCSPTKANDQACQQGSECQSGACVNNLCAAACVEP